MTFHLGPMLPLIRGTRNFSAKAIEIEINTCPEGSGTTVIEFLDECLISDGKQSVIYISFGTEHWLVFHRLQMYDFYLSNPWYLRPSSLDHLEILLDNIVARKHPFVSGVNAALLYGNFGLIRYQDTCARISERAHGI
jgi:hypothetical protein